MTHQQQNTDTPDTTTRRRPRMTDEQRRTATRDRHPQAVTMLENGATHHQVAEACGISIATASNIRRTLGIAVPDQRPGPKHGRDGHSDTQRRLDDDVARLLTEGRTYEEIRLALRVGGDRITRVLHERRIALPTGRNKRTRAERAAVKKRALAMLRAGATYRHIHAETGIDLNTISALRKQHNIPIPDGAPGPKTRKPGRTLAEALALHTEPYGDGHARWAGPRSGHQDMVCAEGRRYNARRRAFQAHHQREPDGDVTPSCTEPRCIAGAHLTDRTIRQQPTPHPTDTVDTLYDAIFGDHQ